MNQNEEGYEDLREFLSDFFVRNFPTLLKVGIAEYIKTKKP
jgi:hypothetical protein